MNETERAAVIVQLADALNEASDWCGATHLQKTTYFLQELTHVELECDFILYKHGPFSFDLRDEITEMVTYDLMDVELNPAPYGPNLVPSDLGKKIQTQQSDSTRKHQAAVEFVAAHLGNKGVAQLERLGTALFVTLEDESVPSDKRSARIRELKPHITAEQAREAVREVDELQQQWAAASE